MKLYGSIDSLLEYSLAASNYFVAQELEQEQSDSLEYLLQDKLDSFSNILAQIERDIKNRSDLSKNVIHQIVRHYCYIKTKLYELETWQLGANRSIEGRRSNLEGQLDNLNREKRQEQVQCWRDIAQLTKEFRDWFKQYCDLMQRVKIITQDVQGESQFGNPRMGQSRSNKKRLTDG